ncbi:hypothetical protein MMPV_000380 [Pyropia vietnamensis]
MAAAAVTALTATCPPHTAFAKPFPTLPDTAIGRFHLLPSFFCNDRAPVDGAGDGTRGFSVRPAQPPASAATVRRIPDATCLAPVENPELLLALPTPADNLAGIGHAQLFRTDWIANDRRLAGSAGELLTVRVKLLEAGPSVGAPWSMVHPFIDDGLMYEADVARLLTLQRNSVGGAALRVSGTWEVMSLSRFTGGLCLNANCSDFSAVATLQPTPAPAPTPTPPDLPAPAANTPTIITRTPTAGEDGPLPTPAPNRPVPMFEHEILSLGRALQVDPAWLPNATLWVPPPAIAVTSGTAFHAQLTRSTAGGFRASAAMEMAAFGFCQEPVDAFITDPERYCGGGGVPEAGTVTEALRVSAGSDSGDTVVVKTADEVPSVDVEWTWAPGGGAAAALPAPAPCVVPVDVAYAPRPAWLAGTGSREIAAEASSEVDLANSLGTCSAPSSPSVPGAPAPTAAPVIPADAYALLRLAERDARRTVSESLARAYDAPLFRKDEPALPSEASDIVLAIVVVMPALVAQAVFLVSSPGKWDIAAQVTFLASALGGLFSLAGLVTLAVGEAKGSRFRAAGLRDALHVEYVGGVTGAGAVGPVDLTGSRLLLSETLFIVARNGYRRGLLIGLTVGWCVAFVLLSAGLYAIAMRLPHPRTAPKSQGGQHRGGVTDDGGGKTPDADDDVLPVKGEDVVAAAEAGSRGGAIRVVAADAPATPPAVAAVGIHAAEGGVGRRRRWRKTATSGGREDGSP